MNSNLGEDLEIPYRPFVSIPLILNFKLPALFTRSRAQDNQIEQVKSFFQKEGGSISVSEAMCATHRIDLSSRSKKKDLSTSFKEAVKGLYMVSNETEMRKDFEFHRFINEFGTHYASRTILGVRLYSERRYSFKETSEANDRDLKACNTANAVKLIGMQVNEDEFSCDSPDLLGQNFASDYLQRYVVTTFGSYAMNNFSEWNNQLKQMQTRGILSPTPVKRKLRPIVELFLDQSILVNPSILREFQAMLITNLS